MTKFVKHPILCPVLFAIYPVLHIYANNLMEAEFKEFFIYSSITLITTLIVFKKDSFKAAFITAIIVLLFLSYGHIFDYVAGLKVGLFDNLEDKWIISCVFGRHRYIFGFFILMVSIIFIWLLRTKKDLRNITKVGTFISIILFIWPIYQIISFKISPEAVWTEQVKESSKAIDVELPDIYYIIPDGHTRSDTLKANFDYDLSDFEENLERKGFYVADRSSSNYSMTHLSLPTALSMNYIDKFFDIEEKKDVKWGWETWSLLNTQNQVKEDLKELGYTWVSFDSGYKSSMKNNTDIFLTDYQGSFEFYNVLFNTTPLRIFIKEDSSLSPARIRRNRVLYTFDKLKEIPNIQAPTFTLAHIIVPHSPYIFDRNGDIPDKSIKYLDGTVKKNDTNELKEMYIDQLYYTDEKILETVDVILKTSKNPPIIIIQADHGIYSAYTIPDPKDPDLHRRNRLAILNAYYFPDQNYSNLYSSISPVNSFRIILNQYFEKSYNILPDH
ncbi:hypothetical protein ACFL14_02905, partial [Patescibacteria group bacterium]